MRPVVAAVNALRAYGDAMETPLDMVRYARLRLEKAWSSPAASRGPPVPLRVRALNGLPVLCRPSQDVWTFKYTFVSQFHLPPVALREGALILDLGSNVGYTVAHLAQVHPTARVIGVEMDAANFALAQLNTAAYGERVRLVHAAVWTHDGEIAYGGDGDDAFAVSGDTGPRRAPAVRVDTILAAHGVTQVDYVKMDVEGAEAAILAEPADWLDCVRTMKIELHPPATMESIRGVLEARGFTCSIYAQHPRCLIALRP
ncbi:MAG: FkbM family methyltransferase [bacterium]